MSVLLDLAGWFGSVVNQTQGIKLRFILLACALQGGQTVLNGLSWRNILRASYPDRAVPTRAARELTPGGARQRTT